MRDATGGNLRIYLAEEYSQAKKRRTLPDDHAVLLGQRSGGEIKLSQPGVVDRLSLDWVMVRVTSGKPSLIIPCEIQSIDTTGNYHLNWRAYSKEAKTIPNSEHGMNWANVWKRLIPQLMLKGAIASASALCKKGSYFVLPARVYAQFRKIVGPVDSVAGPGQGVLNVRTYSLGPPVPFGSMRSLTLVDTIRMRSTEFADAFASGEQMKPLGIQLDRKVTAALDRL